MLGEVDIVIVVMPDQVDERVEIAMSHNTMPERNFFSRGTGFHCGISVYVIDRVLEVIECAGRGQIWQGKTQTG